MQEDLFGDKILVFALRVIDSRQLRAKTITQVFSFTHSDEFKLELTKYNFPLTQDQIGVCAKKIYETLHKKYRFYRKGK